MADHIWKGNPVVPFNFLYATFEVPKHHANLQIWENQAFDEFVREEGLLLGLEDGLGPTSLDL